MSRRLQLHNILLNIIKNSNVYFQPPSNKTIAYPCIIYKRVNMDIRYANNLPYKNKKQYNIIVIDSDPDSKIHEKIAQLPRCSFDRSYTANNLNHDVFNIYY